MSKDSSSERLEVAIVGQGRLGSTVSSALEEAGHIVHRVSRHQAIPAAPIVWLTVPDGAIRSVAAQCPTGGVVLHASGASDLTVLEAHASRAGSLHPLMTFPGGAPPPLPVPAAIEGSPIARACARQLALAMGWTPFEVSGDRRAYHAAAVLAGNFATTLLAEAAGVLTAAGVPAGDAPALLAPLALRSLENAVRMGPSAALTGPVVRNETAVLRDHRAVLAAVRPATVPVYEALVEATQRLAQENAPTIANKVD
ncbi:MAG: stilbene synthase [Deltaproteobacteria bacterium]|nr:stilbene synthase [Deltaproteobacteria bacterium]HCH65655.1 DUF2520 domain-containing protein [Deltaproteobacteria bacterium]